MSCGYKKAKKKEGAEGEERRGERQEGGREKQRDRDTQRIKTKEGKKGKRQK